MEQFFTTKFGSVELEIIDSALEEWRLSKGIDRADPDFEIAAAAMINLFREGNTTVPALRKAAAGHKWLSEDLSMFRGL